MIFDINKEEMKETYAKSFDLAKAIAESRDEKIIEGFINKTKEEYAFNDFYNNGNEDVLRYAGVVVGLEELGHPYFRSMDKKHTKLLKSIKKIAESLTKDNLEHARTFEQYKLGAEYCLHDYIEEEMKYSKLDNRALFYEILREGATHSDSRNTSPKEYKRIQKQVLAGDVAVRTTEDIAKLMDNKKYFQKNAYYAVKRFHWMHEKGTFDNMGELELKGFYEEQVQVEKRYKFELENGIFYPHADDDFGKVFLSS